MLFRVGIAQAIQSDSSLRTATETGAELNPLRANFVALDAHQTIDHLRPSQHTFASCWFVALQGCYAAVPAVPFEIVSARTDQDSFE